MFSSYSFFFFADGFSKASWCEDSVGISLIFLGFGHILSHKIQLIRCTQSPELSILSFSYTSIATLIHGFVMFKFVY